MQVLSIQIPLARLGLLIEGYISEKGKYDVGYSKELLVKAIRYLESI